MANLVFKYAKKSGQIVLYLLRDIQLQNFQGRNPSNVWVANLENRWLHKIRSDIIWPLDMAWIRQKSDKSPKSYLNLDLILT